MTEAAQWTISTLYHWLQTTAWPITLISHSCPQVAFLLPKQESWQMPGNERCKQKLEHCSNKHYLHFLAPNNAWQCTTTTGAFIESGRIELRPLWEVAEETRQSGMRRTIFIVASFLILPWKTPARSPQGRCQLQNNHTRTPQPRRRSKHIRRALSKL